MPMPLTPKQQTFLLRRRPLIRAYPWVAGSLLTLTIAAFIGLVHCSPLLFNPVYVMDRVKTGTLCVSTMQLMAGMLPLMAITCLFAVAALVAILISALGHERTYLRIIEQLQQEPGDQSQV